MELAPITGRLLIAEPSILNDNDFNRSVILITKNDDEEGIIGFIMNKETKYTIQDLIPSIHSSIKVFCGGPVATENLYFLHNKPLLIKDSIQISDNIYWTSDLVTISKLLNEGKINHSNIRFFLGYSGWGTNQLAEELSNDSWVVVENEYPNVFQVTSSKDWKEQLLKLGGEYILWANAPVDPTLN